MMMGDIGYLLSCLTPDMRLLIIDEWRLLKSTETEQHAAAVASARGAMERLVRGAGKGALALIMAFSFR